MKKKLIICVGSKPFIESLGLETQALDSEGIGTGLPNVKITPDIEITSVSDIRELSTLIKNDLDEDKDRIVLLDDNMVVNPVDQHRLEDIKSQGVVAVSAPEIVVKNIVSKINDTSPELIEAISSTGVEGFVGYATGFLAHSLLIGGALAITGPMAGPVIGTANTGIVAAANVVLEKKRKELELLVKEAKRVAKGGVPKLLKNGKVSEAKIKKHVQDVNPAMLVIPSAFGFFKGPFSTGIASHEIQEIEKQIKAKTKEIEDTVDKLAKDLAKASKENPSTEGHGDEPELDPYGSPEAIEENFFNLEGKPSKETHVLEEVTEPVSEEIEVSEEHCDSPEEQASVSYTRDMLYKEITDDILGVPSEPEVGLEDSKSFKDSISNLIKSISSFFKGKKDLSSAELLVKTKASYLKAENFDSDKKVKLNKDSIDLLGLNANPDGLVKNLSSLVSIIDLLSNNYLPLLTRHYTDFKFGEKPTDLSSRVTAKDFDAVINKVQKIGLPGNYSIDFRRHSISSIQLIKDKPKDSASIEIDALTKDETGSVISIVEKIVEANKLFISNTEKAYAAFKSTLESGMIEESSNTLGKEKGWDEKRTAAYKRSCYNYLSDIWEKDKKFFTEFSDLADDVAKSSLIYINESIK